jgi:hypothetical protein
MAVESHWVNRMKVTVLNYLLVKSGWDDMGELSG